MSDGSTIAVWIAALASVVALPIGCIALSHSRRGADAAEKTLRIEQMGLMKHRVRFAQLVLPVARMIDTERSRAREAPESELFQPTNLTESGVLPT